MFTKDDLNTMAVLVKSGIKTMDLTGNNLIIAGALMRKIEEQLAKPEPKAETPVAKKEEKLVKK